MDRYGYWNKILHVDLGDRRTWIEEPGDAFFRRYAGGRGLIAHYLLKYVPKGADALGPENILVIAPGVITGMPVLNYRLGAAETVGKVDAIAVRDQVRVRMGACYACSVRCKKVVHIEEKEEAARQASETVYKGRARVAFDPLGRYRVDPRYGGPEYESLASLGVNLGLDDLIAICKSNEMCNFLGMDTVSLGCTLAWAMECFEK